VRSKCHMPGGFAAVSQRFRNMNAQTLRAAVIKRCTRSARVAESCRELGRTLLATLGDGLAGEVPRSRCRSGARAAAKPAAAMRARGRQQVRTGCHTCAHVPTRAHGCAAGATFQAISHIRTVNELAQRAAAYKAWCLLCARCCVVSQGRANAARNAGDGLAGEVPRSRCRSGARAAAKPSAAMRAHWREQVRAGCHTCGHVPTRAHGCAAGAAFQAISHIRTVNELAQRAAAYKAWCLLCARCCVVSSGGANAACNVGDRRHGR
jgi:hypothetical protein